MRLQIRASLAHSRRRDLRGSTASGSAPKPLVAALFWPLNSKLGGGRRTRMAQPRGCASPPDLPAGNAGCSSSACAVGPWRLGTVSRSLPCAGVARGGCSAVLCLAAGHGAGPIASYRVRHARATAKYPVVPGRGSTTSHNVTSDHDSHRNVLARVPTSPVTYNQPNYSNSKHLRPAPLAPKYWVFKGP